MVVSEHVPKRAVAMEVKRNDMVNIVRGLAILNTFFILFFYFFPQLMD
jgi:hypothetical protein